MNNNSKFWIIALLVVGVLYMLHQNPQHNQELVKMRLMDQIEQANQRRLLEQKNDDDEWEQAERLNTIGSFEEYVESNPSGRHLSSAIAAIERLKEEERIKKEHEERQKIVQKMAAIAGDQIIVNAYQDGINKTTSVTEWSFTPSDETGKGIYTITVDLSWNGNVFASNYYKASGVISVNEDGTDFKWAPTYINETLAKYLDDISSAAIVLGVLNSFNKE